MLFRITLTRNYCALCLTSLAFLDTTPFGHGIAPDHTTLTRINPEKRREPKKSSVMFFMISSSISKRFLYKYIIAIVNEHMIHVPLYAGKQAVKVSGEKGRTDHGACKILSIWKYGLERTIGATGVSEFLLIKA